MPRTGGLATPSMHPYRPFAARSRRAFLVSYLLSPRLSAAAVFDD